MGVLVAGLLAGCVGSGEGNESTPTGSATASLSAEPGAPVGTVRGSVYDPELSPISGAAVGIVKLNTQVLTDAQGSFAISGIAVGEYDLLANRLGYQARATKVVVNADETTWVNFTLTPLAIEEAFPDTYIRSEIIECMLQTPAWVSACSWPYTAVYLEAHKNGVNLSEYGAPADIQDNEVRFNFSVGYGVRGIVSEMVWKPNTDNAREMFFYTCLPESYDPVQDYCEVEYGSSGQAASPLRMEWSLPKDRTPKAQGQLSWIMMAIWPGGVIAPGVVLEQKVDTYSTAFYNGDVPEDWSYFGPDGPPPS